MQDHEIKNVVIRSVRRCRAKPMTFAELRERFTDLTLPQIKAICNRTINEKIATVEDDE